jgi:hypothetical protein
MRGLRIVAGETTLEVEQIVFPVHQAGDVPDKLFFLDSIIPDDQGAHCLEIRAFIDKFAMMSSHEVSFLDPLTALPAQDR